MPSPDILNKRQFRREDLCDTRKTVALGGWDLTRKKNIMVRNEKCVHYQ